MTGPSSYTTAEARGLIAGLLGIEPDQFSHYLIIAADISGEPVGHATSLAGGLPALVRVASRFITRIASMIRDDPEASP